MLQPMAKGETSVREPEPIERAVARRTAEARATIPDLELSLEVEIGDALDRARAQGVSLDALLVSACARALRAVPQANGAYRDGHFEAYSRVNVGFVVAGSPGPVGRGSSNATYLVPTVFDADQKSPGELTAALERLVADAQAGVLAQPAFSGATFTVWNAGALGVSAAGPVINPPQAAALAAGAVREQPVVNGGRVEVGRVMTLTLASDHRILYGAEAADFLHAVAGALAGPAV
jgi:pyruvate dehydrogenase E2 component (dihydrolipoamide acetyltransferase)